MKTPIVVDFETHGIARRPQYPPVPVGVSIWRPDREKKPTYYSWGHPSENNCDKEKGYRIVRDVWNEAARTSGPALLFQNGKFDCDVAETHINVRRIPWDKIHDSMFLIAIHDPHAPTFSLKPSAERILGMKPAERDAVKDWILAHVPEAKKKPSKWGAYIWRAPGKLVGKYADGDDIRTYRLFKKLIDEVNSDDAPKGQQSMMDAYNRERELMPILLDTEREGLQVDLPALERDYSMFSQALGTADKWLNKTLKCDINWDADEDVANILDARGIITEWVMTKTGRRSVAKKNMTLDMFENQRVASVYGYRVRLRTCLSMFFEPWLEMARASGGVIYTNWNQVRQSRGESSVGARTGRLSSNPNLQNIPTDFLSKGDAYVEPFFLKALPVFLNPDGSRYMLPFMRKYLLPGKGRKWIKRDYSQQEIRMLAHYEDGYLLHKYQTDPKYDLHLDVQVAIKTYAGLALPRGPVKILNFGDIYGMGFTAFHEKTKISKADYDKIKAAKKALLPDLAELDADIKLRGKQGMPIRTWGGRLYFCEAPMFIKKYGRVMSFEYKLLNYLIQGSSADVTKQAVINYSKHPKRTAQFLLTVHDELNASAPKREWKAQQAVLAECMADIPGVALEMRSDGGVGDNWHDLEDCD